MGVLKNITKEYFGESLRKEDGKTVTVGKHKIIIPPGYDVKSFFDAFNKMYHKLPKKFHRGAYKKDGDVTVIEGGDKSGFDLCIYTYNFLKKKTYFVDGFTENMYNTLVDALRVEMADIYMVTNGFAIVANEADFLDVFKRQGVDEEEFPKFINKVLSECVNIFSLLVRRTGVHYGESDIILVVKSMSVFIESILSYSAVKEWFDEKLAELKRDGVEKYVKQK